MYSYRPARVIRALSFFGLMLAAVMPSKVCHGQGQIGSPGGGSPAGTDPTIWSLGTGTVLSQQKISDLEGGLPPGLDDEDVFGSSVAELGDLDGDGVVDLAVGAPGDDDGGQNRGAVWILFQDQDGTVGSVQKISDLEGGFTGVLEDANGFGTSVVSLGDLDGDGAGDLAVGAPRESFAVDRGAVWVLFLNPDGTVKAHQKIGPGTGGFTGVLNNGDLFGWSLASLGDLDGDGVLDLAVGSTGDAINRGAVWVLFLNPDGTVNAQQKISSQAGGGPGSLSFFDRFGSSVASPGDLDGDGVVDLAVGAEGDDENPVTLSDAGAVWILFLRTNGTARARQLINGLHGGMEGLYALDAFGSSVASLGDFDGDGIGDLAVGSRAGHDGMPPLFDLGRGTVWVLFLNADGTIKQQQKISAVAGGFTGILDERDGFGSSVSSPGDLDGDGVNDLVAGACFDDDGGTDRGALWVLALDGIATIGFEHGDDAARTALVNGQDVSSLPEFGRTLGLASSGANLGPAIFDSTPGGPNDAGQDRDLLVDLGNVLILQDSLLSQQTVPGVYDEPGDDPDGGIIRFLFKGPVQPISLDLIDVDVSRRQLAFVALIDDNGKQRLYFVPGGWTEDLPVDGPTGFRTLDLTTLAPQPGFAATAAAFQSSSFDATRVVTIAVRLGGSGALDDLRWDPHPDAAGSTGASRPLGRR